MDQATRREPTMESQGYLGNSRVILNHFDAATQADIQHTALSYESEDETMGRSRSRRHCPGSGPPLYSKQDIREQYCISERGLGALERGGSGGGLFGCLAGAGTHATSPCAAAARGSLLTVCVRRRVPSDENIHELCRRQPEDYAPMPRYPRYPWGPTPAELYRYETELECSYFRRRPRSLCGSAPDPSRYTWLPADEEAGRLERPRPVPVRHDLDLRHSAETLAHFAPPPPPVPHTVCLVHPMPLPPPAIAHHDPGAIHRPKHVSFARSHTLTSFDDAVVSIGGCGGSSSSGRLARSQERLLDGRKTADPPPITKQPEPSEPQRILMEKLKRAPMKTQATQTEVCLGRKPIPSAQLTLSPRTIHRVKMVSQGAQTNGVLLLNGRKLMKSYSEAGGTFTSEELDSLDHEPLQRTQSEEPPRSPFIVKTPSPEPEAEIKLEDLEPLPEPIPQPQPTLPSKTSLPTLPPLLQNDETSSVTRSEHDSEDSETKSQKEIIIDFEPQIPSSPLKKKPLLKTASDGEILLDKRRAQRHAEGSKFLPDKNITSVSHDNISIEPEPRSFIPYFQNSPIRHEDIFKDLNNGHLIFSSVENDNDASIFRAQDSLDEEFHENLIYGGLFRKQSSSPSDPEALESNSRNASNSPSPEEDGVVPTLHLLPEQKVSPFASTDSLANDLRDHSDGIWNESQATVLQADSGTENGTGLSASELSSTLSPGTATLLTPSSRRKHLLLQHQQRSSMDTDALDEESQGETQLQQPTPLPRPISPRTIKEPPNMSLLAPPLSETPMSGPLPRRIPGSPGRVRRTPEPPPPGAERGLSDSALDLRGLNGAAIVPDLLLARTDSGRTNTDVSESTTTDDYMTANSGTDSSRRSGSLKGANERHHHHPTQEGSSFESASSMYSLARGDLLAEDMVVPSFSPPPILEEASDAAVTPVPGPGRISRSHSASSSSSGSYSLDGGSCPDLAQSSRKVPSPRHVPSVSDDERSAHYSSSGYYESPLEDDSTSKISRQNADQREWTDEEKRRKKRTFTLEFNKHQLEDQKSSPGDKLKSSHLHKVDKDMELPPQISPRTLTTGTEKPAKRTRVRNRSPMQGRRVSAPHVKKSPPGPKAPELVEDSHVVATVTGAGTSDESSSGVCGDVQVQAQNQSSPRKIRKIREGNRRKSTPRSPTSARTKRRNGSGDDKPASLPGSLPRRRTKHESAIEENHSNTLPATKTSRLSPYKSPSGSPNKRRNSKTSPEVRLKALSAESLRSVSPGSDSVFYSDPSSHAAAPPPSTEHQVHCLHCGKEVDIVTTDDPDKSNASSNGAQPDIVQPPAGFADSPRLKHGRLYKKLEKRFRSEDRTHAEKRHHKYKGDVRAKSEERCGRETETTWTGCARARSASGGSAQLRSAGSSPSVLATAGNGGNHEDDSGLYDEPYHSASWLYLGDSDEAFAWNKSESNILQGGTVSTTAGGPVAEEQEVSRRDSLVSTASTDSEHEFKKRYRAVTQRMVHRKSCLEMYKRQASKSFESDKTIVVRRESGEFGFRIHGSKPVVVSAIEPDTPAESSGLEVGDIVLAVNGVSVLDKSHSEVVKIAHAGSDTLTLEVARTCGVLSPPAAAVQESTCLYSGYLWKQGGHASGTHSNKWIRRWFCLKKDNCLYTYKTDIDQQPVGAMMLHNYIIERISDDSPGAAPRSHRLCLRRSDSLTVPLHLAADNETAVSRWTSVLTSAAEKARHADMWLEQTRRLLATPPAQLPRPDCFGYLNKLGTKWKTWNRRYCVLKDACMYFYQDANSKGSFGMACLHGYRVQQSAAGGKKHAFEILPSDSSQKHFYFHTETEMDRKRWLAALEYSIDRWLKVG